VNKEYYLKDDESERGSGEKKVWFVEGGKMVAASWQCSGTFLPSDSWYSHKACDSACPSATVLGRPCTSRLLFLHHAEIHTERIADLSRSMRLKKIHWTWNIKSVCEYFEAGKTQQQQNNWENDLFKLFGFLTDRPRMYL
jgi:hypothetical protein